MWWPWCDGHMILINSCSASFQKHRNWEEPVQLNNPAACTIYSCCARREQPLTHQQIIVGTILLHNNTTFKILDRSVKKLFWLDSSKAYCWSKASPTHFIRWLIPGRDVRQQRCSVAAWDHHITAVYGMGVKPRTPASLKPRSQPLLLPRRHFSWTFRRPRAVLIRNLLSKQF